MAKDPTTHKRRQIGKEDMLTRPKHIFIDWKTHLKIPQTQDAAAPTPRIIL